MITSPAVFVCFPKQVRYRTTERRTKFIVDFFYEAVGFEVFWAKELKNSIGFTKLSPVI